MFTCPNCGSALELELKLSNIQTCKDENLELAEQPRASVYEKQFRLKGGLYTLSTEDFLETALKLRPWRALQKHYTIFPDELGQERQVPIRQLVLETLKRKYPNDNFEGVTTQDAVRVLTAIGIPTYTRY